MTLRDAATGLPTWELFLDRLQHAVQRAERRQHALTVALISVDFPALGEDADGWPAGWRTELVGRLRDALRDDDTLAVTPGPLFAALLEDGAGELGAVAPAQRLLSCVDAPLGGATARMQVGLGLGVPPLPPAREVLLLAEVALGRAMQRAGSAYAVFDPALDGPLLRRLRHDATPAGRA